MGEADGVSGRQVWAVGALAAMMLALSACAGATPPAESASPSVVVSERTAGEIPGGWRVVSVDRWILDRTSGTYAEMRTPGAQATVLPALSGNLVAVIDEGDAGRAKIEIVTTRGEPQRTVQLVGVIGGFHWSPQGDRLVTQVMEKETGAMKFVIIDALSGGIRSF